eukprot:5350560-Prymnesium_polylepis.1
MPVAPAPTRRPRRAPSPPAVVSPAPPPASCSCAGVQCEPPCPRVTPSSETDVEEEECGAAGDRVQERYAPCMTTPRDAAPAAAPAHSPLP